MPKKNRIKRQQETHRRDSITGGLLLGQSRRSRGSLDGQQADGSDQALHGHLDLLNLEGGKNRLKCARTPEIDETPRKFHTRKNEEIPLQKKREFFNLAIWAEPSLPEQAKRPKPRADALRCLGPCRTHAQHVCPC
jgi:hypothetical protein